MRLKAADFAAYQSRWGLGVGTTGLDTRLGAWDVRRFGKPDASAHALLAVFPFTAHVALASWKGLPYFHFTESRAADQGIGHVELFGSYCPWGILTGFNEATGPASPSSLGLENRQAVDGSVTARVLDAGLRADLGSTFAFSVGRLELDTKADDIFKRRYSTKWYAAVDLYFGALKGTEYGGGFFQMFVDGWNWARARSGNAVHRRVLKGWSAAE